MIFQSAWWMNYLLFFALFAKSLWFFYYFSLYAYKTKKYSAYKGKVALIVPVYNEDEDKLKDTIQHAKNVSGLDQIVFVNDGSTNNVQGILEKHAWPVCKIINLKQNVGKRLAQLEGIKRVDEDTDVFVFMDSDTLLQKNSVTELLRPMSDENVGGVTAQILVKNKNKNFLTRCVAAMYWSASNIWRKAPAKIGFMQVTNGQLSCYRASLVKNLLFDYISQTFMGGKCTISDDRWLTHHIQYKYKKRIEYAERSVAYTFIPENVKATYKMFLRWKLGSLRESLLLLKKAFKTPVLLADVWANHLVAFMQTIVRVSIICIAFVYPIILLYYLIIMIIISLLFAFEMIIREPRQIPYRISYSLLNEMIFSWVLIHALLTIKNQGKWGTR